MSSHKRRAPPPVQVAFDNIAVTAQFHATAASPASKSGAFTGGRVSDARSSSRHSLTGIFMGSSLMSQMSSHEADYRYLEMRADTTISRPIAQLCKDTARLEASVELQAQIRRLLKRTMYCELFPWCEAAPMHPSDRMRLPPLIPSNGNCHTGVYTYPNAQYTVEFEETPYMWRCVPGKTLRICRRCGQPAKCGPSSVWGYSIKSNPSGYACRDSKTTRNVTGKTMVSLSSTGYCPETLPTGFSLTRTHE